MSRIARDVPPPLELLCLQALWTLEEGNVKAVQQYVAQSRPLAYTTIMTVLDRLVRKGRLARRKVGRAFLYSPQTSRDTMRRAVRFIFISVISFILASCGTVPQGNVKNTSRTFTTVVVDAGHGVPDVAAWHAPILRTTSVRPRLAGAAGSAWARPAGCVARIQVHDW